MNKKHRTAKERELARKIKIIEQNKREEMIARICKKEPPKAISFDQWWMNIKNKITIPHHVKEIIRVDFKARGLADKELEDKFNQALELFGYKLPK